MEWGKVPTYRAPSLCRVLRSASALLLFVWPAAAAAQERHVDARLRTEVSATTPVGSDVGETDLDLDSHLDLGFQGLLLPELAGRLGLRDRRDLNEPPQGSALHDAWDSRPGRDQERLEQAWLEFGDRLALRAGRQFEWAGAPVRYDGASIRLRRLEQVVEAIAFGGVRARLDAPDADLDPVPVVGGRLHVRFGQVSLYATSLYVDTHLLDLDLTRRLGPRQYLFNELRFRLGYSQLGLTPREARAAAEATLRHVPLRLFLTIDSRLTRTENELVFDYTTVQSESATHDVRLHLEPPPPNIRVEARAQLRPTQVLTTTLLLARRQLVDPSDTSAFSYSYSEGSLRIDFLSPDGAQYLSAAFTVWLPDQADPPAAVSPGATDGEGERRSIRLSGTAGLRAGRWFDASLGIVERRFDYRSAWARIDGIDALSVSLRVQVVPAPYLSFLAWGAYDEALPVLDLGLRAAVAAGLRAEVKTP